MRSFNFIVALLFAFVGFSVAFPDFPTLEARKGKHNSTTAQTHAAKNGTAKNTANKVCRKMAELTKLTTLAANTTKLDELMAKGKLNQTEVTKLQAKATNATAELAKLTANATLVSTCEVVAAHEKVVGECKMMNELTKLAALANNQTAMEAMITKKKLNGTKLTKFEERIGNASMVLTKLQSNTTLTSLCASEKASNTNDGSSASGTAAAAAASTGGAATLTLQTAPYLLVPMLAGAFAAFL